MRLFLSYHTPDRSIALALKAALERALPGTDVFVDQTHLRHGHLWQPALFHELLPVSRTPGLGVMMGPEVADGSTEF